MTLRSLVVGCAARVAVWQLQRARHTIVSRKGVIKPILTRKATNRRCGRSLAQSDLASEKLSVLGGEEVSVTNHNHLTSISQA